MGMAEKRSPPPATERGRKEAGLITKTLDRCRSAMKPAEGSFSVYVGARRQRFAVRTDCVNHPLFRALLDEAEEAFGYAAAGPLELPCDPEAFALVLDQIEEDRLLAGAGAGGTARRCGLVRGNSAYRLLGSTDDRRVIAARSS